MQFHVNNEVAKFFDDLSLPSDGERTFAFITGIPEAGKTTLRDMYINL